MNIFIYTEMIVGTSGAQCHVVPYFDLKEAQKHMRRRLRRELIPNLKEHVLVESTSHGFQIGGYVGNQGWTSYSGYVRGSQVR